jgi:anti-anti-sigma factor
VEIKESYLDAVCVLRPGGRIDGGTSQEFQAKLVQAIREAGAGVVVDFSDVDYISSAGLRVIMTGVRQRKDKHLAVACLKPVIVEIFEIARFQHVVKIHPTVEAAAASWSPPAAS